MVATDQAQGGVQILDPRELEAREAPRAAAAALGWDVSIDSARHPETGQRCLVVRVFGANGRAIANLHGQATVDFVGDAARTSAPLRMRAPGVYLAQVHPHQDGLQDVSLSLGFHAAQADAYLFERRLEFRPWRPLIPCDTVY